MRAILLSLFLSLAAFAPANVRPVLERVSFAPEAASGTFVVRIHADEPFGAYSAPRLDGDVLEVQLFHTDLARDFRADAPRGPITGVEARPSGRHLVLRFTLSGAVDASILQDRGSHDLLLTLRGTFAPSEPSAVLPAPPMQIDRVERPQPLPGTTTTQGGTRWRFDTVVIDAGHGGKDSGARGNGLREKDITLAVALKVGAYVRERLGVDVIYTRRDDRFIELRDRGRIANDAEGKLFVSIHVNSAPGAAARRAVGTETYFLGLHKNAAAKAVMERENAVVQLEDDPDAYADFDEEALILRTMANSLYLRKSERLAALVEQQFAERVGRKSRGVKQAGLMVLWGASMPAILVELGFITNPSEARFMASDEGQEYLASAIFRAIRDFKAEYEHELDMTVSDR